MWSTPEITRFSFSPPISCVHLSIDITEFLIIWMFHCKVSELHFDPNEKLVMFGVTYVMAFDGFSIKSHNMSLTGIAIPLCQLKTTSLFVRECTGKITWLVLFAVCLCFIFCLWDQVRIDCGKEFYLAPFIQERLAEYSYNWQRQPSIQTPSTRVTMWC